MRTLVVVPTYNEASNIAELAERLLAIEPAVDVLIVDDLSPDGTGAISDDIAEANTRFHVMHRQGPRGYSKASVAGLGWGIARGYEALATMDADLSHDPSMLPALVSAVESGADVAIGSRYIPGGESVVDWGPVRRAVSRSGSRYARLMIGTKVRDCTSGFRCYRASRLDATAFSRIRSDGYSFLIELLAQLVDHGAIIVEVPITYVDRRAGSSKISSAIVLEALAETTRLGLARLSGARPLRHATAPVSRLEEKRG